MEIKRIVIAPDSFKGCLSASEATAAMEAGVRKINPHIKIFKFPMSDGGEGSLDIFRNAGRYELDECKAVDPLGRQIKTSYLFNKEKKCAIIESASVCGLTLLKSYELNPMVAGSRGLGIVIREAIERGCQKVSVLLGGSAVNDCGMGMLSELGYRFYNNKGAILWGNGENLKLIRNIDSHLYRDLYEGIDFEAICDVNNPLLGDKGCAKVYSPQKGATPKMVKELEKGAENLVKTAIKEGYDRNENIPGAGAAGGLGYAFVEFLGGKIVSGIDKVLELYNMDSCIDENTLVLTGEGSVDRQSVMGKVLSGILQLTQQSKSKVIIFGGIVKDEDLIRTSGAYDVFSIDPGGLSKEELMKPEVAAENLENRVSQVLKSIIGKNNQFL